MPSTEWLRFIKPTKIVLISMWESELIDNEYEESMYSDDKMKRIKQSVFSENIAGAKSTRGDLSIKPPSEEGGRFKNPSV